MIPAIDELFRARTGPMTADMVLHPAEFGLGRMPARLKPAATTSAVCGFCSTGCALKIHLNERGEAINLTADPGYPVNLGMACPKGWEALTPLAAPDRATVPLLRDPRTPGAALAPVSWESALGALTENFKRIQRQHGPHAIGFLSTGQIVMEEMALLGALAKFGMGLLHVDSNTRQCMATSHVAYKQSFGFDAPPFTYASQLECRTPAGVESVLYGLQRTSACAPATLNAASRGLKNKARRSFRVSINRPACRPASRSTPS